MVGVDPRDAATKASAGKAGDYVKALDAGALKGARIGVARKRYFGYSPATDAVIDAAMAAMKARGAVIVDPADIPTAASLDECELEILLYEFKADLNAYLRGARTVGAGALARRRHRLQRTRGGARDAILRTGDVRVGAEEGTADGPRVPRRRWPRAARARARSASMPS